MPSPEKLLARLDEIARSLQDSGGALALIGVGSSGSEMDRLDAYSDLDFFAIVQPGRKTAYLADLSWMSRPCPVAFAFRNTPDGFKLLYEDGIFAEFAVFEPEELERVPFASGRVIWAAPGVDPSIGTPRVQSPASEPRPTEWIAGEAITNLYVGLCRYHRGEKLSALAFIQGYAVDRLLELIERTEPPSAVSRDPFTPERRFEARRPQYAELLPRWKAGYEAIPQSALAILEFLETRVEVNPKLKARILELI